MMSFRLVLALLVLLPRLVLAADPPKYTISRSYTGGMDVVEETISIVPKKEGNGALISVTRKYDGGRTETVRDQAMSAKEYQTICTVLERQSVMSLANVPKPKEEDTTDLLTYEFKVKRGDSAEKTLSVYGPEILSDQPAYNVVNDTVGEAGQRAVEAKKKGIKTGMLRRRGGRGGLGGQPGEGLVGSNPNDPVIQLSGSPRPSNI
jgi:hypothetical protein